MEELAELVVLGELEVMQGLVLQIVLVKSVEEVMVALVALVVKVV